ncbi:MAG: hypothetical protein ACOZQL_01000 [Myxococcota bacterium]
MNAPPAPTSETAADVEQLNLLRVLWFVLAALHALGGCVPIVHLTLGVAMVNQASLFNDRNGPPPEAFGWFFIGIAVFLMAVIWTSAVLAFLVGRRLGERRSGTFITVVAALTCLSMPLGTLLGVFTLVVLQRPQVKASFQRSGG